MALPRHAPLPEDPGLLLVPLGPVNLGQTHVDDDVEDVNLDLGPLDVHSRVKQLLNVVHRLVPLGTARRPASVRRVVDGPLPPRLRLHGFGLMLLLLSLPKPMEPIVQQGRGVQHIVVLQIVVFVIFLFVAHRQFEKVEIELLYVHLYFMF